MPLLRSRRSPTRTVGRAVPWLLVLEALQRVDGHWKARLSPRERRRLLELLRASRGRPSTLSPREGEELRALVRRLELGTLGRDLAPLGLRARPSRTR